MQLGFVYALQFPCLASLSLIFPLLCQRGEFLQGHLLSQHSGPTQPCSGVPQAVDTPGDCRLLGRTRAARWDRGSARQDAQSCLLGWHSCRLISSHPVATSLEEKRKSRVCGADILSKCCADRQNGSPVRRCWSREGGKVLSACAVDCRRWRCKVAGETGSQVPVVCASSRLLSRFCRKAEMNHTLVAAGTLQGTFPCT